MTNITEDIKYIGVNDREIDLFEGQYEVPNGMAYNSYVILDEKVAVMDTVDRHFTAEWLKNLESALAGRQPDYLIVQHMEPDHSAGIAEFSAAYPDAVIVGNDKTFTMIKNFYGGDFIKNSLSVKNGDTLSLGEHELNFVFAPMVHWPEVMMTYDAKDKVFFSADAFGKFGALDADEDWACEARRYYFGIVGKYGGPVQTLLKKAAGLDIAVICPLHGPVLSENLGISMTSGHPTASRARESASHTLLYTATRKRLSSISPNNSEPTAAQKSRSTTLHAATWRRLLRMRSATESSCSRRPLITEVYSRSCATSSTT